jgi:hypothetical protein
MTGRFRAIAMAVLLAVAAAIVVCLAGCGSPTSPIDLTTTLETAQRNPEKAAFEIRSVEIEGRRQPAIAVPVASRIKWRLKLPGHGRLQTWLAAESGCALRPAKVDFRIGISNDRFFDELLVRAVPTSDAQSLVWQSETIDLYRYGGFQWSVFYRPSEISWTLIFNTRPLGPAAADCVPRPLWGAPAIAFPR